MTQAITQAITEVIHPVRTIPQEMLRRVLTILEVVLVMMKKVQEKPVMKSQIRWIDKEYSNVYVYTEAGTYYGEIIIQSNVSIIYIKQRSSGFDTRIKGVLAELLPDSYNQVWNNYLSATSDRTFTVEGRRVRIVTASGGGHSQIVIYN